MEYVLPGTRGLTVTCKGRTYQLAEDIRSDSEMTVLAPGCDADLFPGIFCLCADVVPVDGAAPDWIYVAHWSVIGSAELAALEAGDISNPSLFDGIIATISTDTEDDMIVIDADGKTSR